MADNIPDGRTVREKLRHEIIHHAMEHVVTPAEYQTIIKTVLKTRDSDNATIREARRKVDASYGKESPEVQAGEFLAHMAEKQPNKFVAAWERVVAPVKGVLRRTGVTEADRAERYQTCSRNYSHVRPACAGRLHAA